MQKKRLIIRHFKVGLRMREEMGRRCIVFLIKLLIGIFKELTAMKWLGKEKIKLRMVK